ncbi:transporter substrate-binding domain-containing protein [Pseudomonas sp. UL070]|uniref:Transporter substrate-binding domain-containing protein n=1 Tax=Aquipseudomonas ullengensis TaxID=2759166 RepID=A0A7W4LKY6_9GAMM|nr:transporter substrate-binding domain-containing protein [Pseudomonas ullengensis]
MLLGLCVVPLVSATQAVRVGAYHFPPYVLKPESATPTGLLPDLLAELNQAQQDYHFDLVPTSVTRRYRDLIQERYDLILFESPDWGWKGIHLEQYDLQVADAEVYVARSAPGRTQAYFDSLRGKRMALYAGYHYGFAGFNADQTFLSSRFNAVLTYSHESNLLMLLHDRADLSVIPRSYLRIYQQQHPTEQRQLLVSQRIDQVYHHHALLRPSGPINAQQLSALFAGLKSRGALQALLQRYFLELSQQGEQERADPMQL